MRPTLLLLAFLMLPVINFAQDNSESITWKKEGIATYNSFLKKYPQLFTYDDFDLRDLYIKTACSVFGIITTMIFSKRTLKRY